MDSHEEKEGELDQVRYGASFVCVHVVRTQSKS